MIFRNIIKDNYLLATFGITTVVLLFTLVLVLIFFGATDTPLIIHFDSYKGIDFLGNKLHVFGIVFVGVVMFLINVGLAHALYYRDRFLSYIIGCATLVIALLILIAVSAIIAVN